MVKYKITLEYDGSKFSGWQRQPHALGVQQVLEESLFNLTQEEAAIFAAGRTDKGVHALGQTCHFTLSKHVPTLTLIRGLNFHNRPHPIVIITAEETFSDFHARFSAKQRYYRYIILNRSSPSALENNRVWHVKYQLDIEAMRQASRLLIGRHDFSSFRAKDCYASSPIRTIDFLEINCVENKIFIDIKAQSFLYHMVRNIVGSLVYVGAKKWDVTQFGEIFQAKDRKLAGPTAPPEGLYFMKVEY